MDKFAKMSDEWRDANNGEMLNLGIFRIGDEQMEDDASTHSAFDYVLRTYANHHRSISYWTQPTHWDENDMKVAWMPNGWGADVGPREPGALLPTSQRPEMCLFAGGRHTAPEWISNRNYMFEVLDQMDHNCVFPPRDIPWRYAAKLSQTKYGLAPGGNVSETIRFYESLENGAVPIVVQEDWMEIAFGYLPLDSPDQKPLPFPVMRNWTEFPALYRRLVSEDAAAQDARQVAVMKWWAEFKDGKRREIANLIDSAFEAKYGPGA